MNVKNTIVHVYNFTVIIFDEIKALLSTWWSFKQGIMKQSFCVANLNSMRWGIIKFLMILSVFISLGGCARKVTITEDSTPVVSVVPTPDVPFDKVPDTEDIVMYEVNLRVFSSEGNFKGVEAKLDSIKGLGVNTIWLMPIHSIGSLKGVGSPYAVRSYTDLNPAFGSLDDLRRLIREAHKKDMAVIMDWVANHTSWDNVWIQNTSWYTQDPSGNIVSPSGWNDVADLNFSSTEMRLEMIKAMKYWVLNANIDGYRCDYAESVPTDFWKQAIDTLRSIPDRKLILFAEGAKKELYSAGFDLIFGWSFYNKLKEVFTTTASATGLTVANTADYTGIPSSASVLRFITNHDFNAWENTPLTIFKGYQGSMAAFVLASYMGGVPLIYNGQEVGCPIKLPFFSSGTEKIDWTINPGMKAEYKKLMAFRNSSQAVKRGSLQAYSSANIMAFKRVSGSEEVLVIVNIRDAANDFKLPSALVNSSWKNALSNATVQLETTFNMSPFSYLILKK